MMLLLREIGTALAFVAYLAMSTALAYIVIQTVILHSDDDDDD